MFASSIWHARELGVVLALGLATVTLATVTLGCQPVVARDRLKQGDDTRDGRLVPRPGPKFAQRPGKEALRRWVERCRQQGLVRRPAVFGKPGVVVVQWAADRSGQLLRLEFTSDSYRGWEATPAGQTLADCVVVLARQDGKIRWSHGGTAPMRLAAAPAAAASQPASRPTSRPAE